MRLTQEQRQEMQQQALARATGSHVLTNYPAIFRGFVNMGIPEIDIKPRENVFTYHAWRALGRHVRKGEHGVKVISMFERQTDERTKDGEPVVRKWFVSATVFHLSQTEAK